MIITTNMKNNLSAVTVLRSCTIDMIKGQMFVFVVYLRFANWVSKKEGVYRPVAPFFMSQTAHSKKFLRIGILICCYPHKPESSVCFQDISYSRSDVLSHGYHIIMNSWICKGLNERIWPKHWDHCFLSLQLKKKKKRISTEKWRCRLFSQSHAFRPLTQCREYQNALCKRCFFPIHLKCIVDDIVDLWTLRLK